MINVHNGLKKQNIPPIKINDYPAIKRHLDHYYSALSKREDQGESPYNLRNCVYLDDFNKPKIVYREISNAMDACLVEESFMLNNKCYLITGDHLLYILSYLNSKLFSKIILPQVNNTGGKGEGFLQEIPLVFPSVTLEKQIQHYYSLREADPQAFDQKIDMLFCDIFGLDEAEKEFVLK